MGPGHEKLRVDRVPGDLRPHLYACGIDGTITVQARQTVEETAWLLELAQQNTFIKGVVGWVDLCSPQLAKQLERFASNPKSCGVRHVLHDEPDERFMLRQDFRRGIGMLAQFDLAYDLLLFPHHLPFAGELVAQFPQQRFVLDHIAKPLIKDAVLSPWEEDIRQLATFPNVYCKVSGLVTEADWQNWAGTDFRPYLDVVFKAFTAQRIMFGSDWPVSTLAGSYQQVYQLINDYVASLSTSEQKAVFGETAVRFYGVPSA
jgi:L-fuconolactonase